MGSGSSKDRPRDFCCPHKANLKKGQSQFGFAPIVSLNTVIRLGQGGGARRGTLSTTGRQPGTVRGPQRVESGHSLYAPKMAAKSLFRSKGCARKLAICTQLAEGDGFDSP